MFKSSKKIILASASPRRKMLLERFGLTFIVKPADIDETVPKNTPPLEAARTIARQKAEKIAETAKFGEIIISADTVVALNGKIYGKPETKERARLFLNELRGRTHQVITGVYCIDTANHEKIEFETVTNVTFTNYDDFLIEKYIASGEGLDRAGAYAIQGLGSLLVEKIDGDYDNVVGLPVAKLVYKLASHKILEFL